MGDTAIVLNFVSPGFVKNDFIGQAEIMTLEEGAKLPIYYALIG